MADKPELPREVFEHARNELFSHILRCGVLEAVVSDQKEWFDDTMDYLADRYQDLTDDELKKLRHVGEQYCRPIIRRHEDRKQQEEEAVGAPNS